MKYLKRFHENIENSSNPPKSRVSITSSKNDLIDQPGYIKKDDRGIETDYLKSIGIDRGDKLNDDNFHIKGKHSSDIISDICKLDRNKSISIIKYLLNTGMDPNVYHSCLLRHAIYSNDMELLKLLVESGAKIQLHRDVAIKWCAEYARLNMIDYLYESGLRNGFKSAIKWASYSTKISSDEIKSIISHLQSYIDSGKVDS